MKSEDKAISIIQAAAQVFSSEGFHKAKISKIAEIAGVGAGTVYLYFESKEAIMEEIFVRSWSRIEAKLIDLQSNKELSAMQKIADIIAEIVSLAIGNIEVAKMILHEFSFWSAGPSQRVNKIFEHTKELLIQIIEQGKAQNEFRSQLISDDAVIFMIGGIWYNLAYRSDNINSFVASEISNSITKIVLNGIC